LSSRLPFLALFVATTAVAADVHAQETRAAKQSADSASGPAIAEHITLVADRDDDDLDEHADALAEMLTPAARIDAVVLESRFAGSTMTPAKGQDHARLVGANGKQIAWGDKIPAGAMLQGLTPGRVVLTMHGPQGKETGVAIDVHGVTMRDGEKHAVDMATEHASLDRAPPSRVDLDDVDQVVDDPDALRVIVASPESASLGPITVESLSAETTPIDAIEPKFTRTACDAGRDAGLVCMATAPLRLVADDVDRRHSLVATRSLKAEVGGAIVVRDAKGKKLQAIRVAGPRHTTAGAIGRYKVNIRPVVMRLTPGGAPSVGGTDAGAVTALKQELSVASSTWGQCGLVFDPSTQVKLANPPPAYLVALGDDVGLPATGGDVQLKIEGKAVPFTLKQGWSTRQAALELQRVATAAGFKAAISENARISSGASPSVDVLLRKADNSLANAELVASSEKTMTISLGSVDLSDGLQHFGDTDSVAGTLEERALVKAVDDGDPRTIEVIVVPFFGGGGRIGESFIGSDGSSMRNVVIMDRAGVRARRTSLTLAHELGHVILDEPGHPDDYGIDTPTLLMDSDASDASPYGPRRITNEDCARAVRQSGPNARIPLLAEWKLTPMRYGK
jgi:hypothetical protein